ncbi:hypothetical protein [Nostoc sp. PA-18-2419]|uniref:hypothetical protein n=1 Tax=Nostoc sp. PA-18-2419 TaxID=2575443 RepID=UPI0011082178|nr:hypothetical protein [Nostoc sp. PA-18-2419]
MKGFSQLSSIALLLFAFVYPPSIVQAKDISLNNAVNEQSMTPEANLVGNGKAELLIARRRDSGRYQIIRRRDSGRYQFIRRRQFPTRYQNIRRRERFERYQNIREIQLRRQRELRRQRDYRHQWY